MGGERRGQSSLAGLHQVKIALRTLSRSLQLTGWCADAEIAAATQA